MYSNRFIIFTLINHWISKSNYGQYAFWPMFESDQILRLSDLEKPRIHN